MHILSSKSKILLFLLSSLYIFTLITICKIFFADVLYVKSQSFLNTGNLSEAINYSNLAIKLNPNEPNYYRERAKDYIVTSTLAENDEQRNGIKDLAYEDLQSAYKLNPTNLATIRNTLPLYYLLSQKDFKKMSGVENMDKHMNERVLQYFQQTKNISPNDVGVYVLFAKYEKKMGWDLDYEESVKKIKVLRPDLLEWQEDLR